VNHPLDEEGCRGWPYNYTNGQAFSDRGCLNSPVADCTANYSCGLCGDGKTCFPLSYFCDGYDDCPSGTDESSTCPAPTYACDTACIQNNGTCAGNYNCVCPPDRGGFDCDTVIALGYVSDTLIDKILGSTNLSFQHPYTDKLSLIRTKYTKPPNTDVVDAYINAGIARNPYNLQQMLRRYCSPLRRCLDFPINDAYLYGVLYIADPLYFQFLIASGRLGFWGVLGSLGGFSSIVIAFLAIFVGYIDMMFDCYESRCSKKGEGEGEGGATGATGESTEMAEKKDKTEDHA